MRLARTLDGAVCYAHAVSGTRYGEVMSETPLLEAVDIEKSFAGVHALCRVRFELRTGEVHALVGENGAGKSTLVKIITGALQPDAGRLLWQGAPIAYESPRHAKQLGIAAIYQQPALFLQLTVAENVALGFEEKKPFSRVDWGGRRRRAAELLARVGAAISPDAEAGTLSIAQQQLVEIARALGMDAKVLILDEPTASLSEYDAENLHLLLRDLRAQGVGIIYISHRLEELTALADRVTVLRDGRYVGTQPMTGVTREELIRLMVGREFTAIFQKPTVTPGEVVLELRNFGSNAAGVRDVDLTVRAGEVVGLAGLVGAGRTELARSIFGLTPGDKGELRLRNRVLHFQTPAHAVAAGIAYLPEDRRRYGAVLEMPVRDNISLAILHRLARHTAIDGNREKQLAARYVERLGIRTPSIFATVGTLSGGNQQKVALSRWLASDPTVLILDEPTQGVDVAAKAEIHALIGELAARGMAILMISSELEEILGMSDRIAVMRGGRIAGWLERSTASQEAVLELALGSRVSTFPARPQV